MTQTIRNYRLALCALAVGVSALLGGCGSRGSVAVGDGQASAGQNVDFAIAYIKRTIPTDATGIAALRALDDLRIKRNFWTKADVYIRAAASPDASEKNITASVTGTDFWDAKDLDVSPDGNTLLFAMRGPLDPNQQDFVPPSWHIWSYTVTTQTLTQLTGGTNDLDPVANDVSPHMLADGRIVFSSTRQIESKAVLTDEALGLYTGNSGPFEAQTDEQNESAFVLHVMNADGSNLHQITFNQSHDTDAAVMPSGQILYTRWDAAPGRTGGSAMHLYTTNPDGTAVQLLYGAQSHETVSTNPGLAATCPGALDCTVQFARSHVLQDGRVLSLVRPFVGADFGGNLQIINVNAFVENNQSVPDTAGAFQPTTALAQSNTTTLDILTQTANDVPVISPGGRFNSAFPLWDGSSRVLVGWNQCRLQAADGTLAACTQTNLDNANSAAPTYSLAPPLYSAWLLNLTDGTLKPVLTPVEGVMVSDIVSLQPRVISCTTTNPYTCPQDLTPPSGFATFGIVDIRSIYDRDGAAVGLAAGQQTLADVATAAAANRPARFLRFDKAVSIGDPQLNDGFPDFDRNLALDNSIGFMRQILGYVPIEPDGSVRVIVPANVAFQITVLDANARALPGFPRHDNWLTVRPGEILTCHGCHEPTRANNGISGRSHGRAGLFTANAGLGLNGGQGTSFNVAAGNGTVRTLQVCAGDTMAQELNGFNCGAAPYNASALSQDVVFNDPWFDGNTNPAGPNAPISYRYSQLTTTQPVSAVCQENWTFYYCRSLINYQAIIDPLWSVARSTTAVAQATCTSCHTLKRKNGNVPVPPDGNLALDDPNATAGVQLDSYVELLATHPAYTLSMNNTLIASGTAPGSIVPGSANASCFFTIVTGASTAGCSPNGQGDGTVNHAGFMTAAELRLLSEWVDIGAQYINNPFDAVPAN